MASVLTALKNAYVAIRGYHTDCHYVVIESDDWGSIRTPSSETLGRLVSCGDNPLDDAFLKNDCLESSKELQNLFDVLTSVRDSKGRPAVMTANFAVANPAFEHIDYNKGSYVYEVFTDTYRKYYPDENVISKVKEGIKQACFCPQLHCREHLNVNRWMNDLKEGTKDTVLAFDNQMIGIGASFTEDNRFGYMDAFNTDFSSDAQLSGILEDAANIFEKVFGYRSSTFVASCFVWNDELEKTLSKLGVNGIQSAVWQNVPVGRNGNYQLKRKIRYAGQRNLSGQIYNVRNCSFEPAYLQNPEECAEKCYQQVLQAFKDKKPAVINSHRFNYIGSINRNNDKNNLIGLKKLLKTIVEAVPDVEFVSTPELIDIMR